MAGNNSIQFLRGNSARRLGSPESLIAGQPFYEMDTNSLYVGGSNGTSLTAATPVNSYYDRIIHNQNEWEAWCTEIENDTFKDSSVLILEGIYNFKGSSGIKLPTTLKHLHGFGNVTIKFPNLTSTSFEESHNRYSCALYYEDKPKQFSPATSSSDLPSITLPAFNSISNSIRNIKIDIGSQEGSGLIASYVVGFGNCVNLNNCNVYIAGTKEAPIAFLSCDYLIDCSATAGANSGAYPVTNFQKCNYLIRCKADMQNNSSGMNSTGFSGCTDLEDCFYRTWSGTYTNNIIGFDSCTNLVNCQGYISTTSSGLGGSSSAFTSCTGLINCIADGVAGTIGFNNCNICTNCRKGKLSAGSGFTIWSKGTNISKDTCPDYSA